MSTEPNVDQALDFATLDFDRERRLGLAEVIYGPGKTPSQITAIANELLSASSGAVLATRIDAGVAADVLRECPAARYDAAARLVVWRAGEPLDLAVSIVTAGTADGPVAAEAAATARAIGLAVVEHRDVGVAGVHRLFGHLAELRAADAVVVVAGMEGALASVVGGLVGVPVIAVPTSTGYGAAFEGVTALLAMLTSCAAGVTVVNIDGGFSAAMAAYRLTRRRRRPA